MSNRYATSQLILNFERQPWMLMGNFAQSGSTGSFASLVASGITYTAKRMGALGNSITIALVAGGTAGSEVVTVSGSAISVQIESGVSTRTQVKTAIDASAGAAALIGVSVASGATAATLVAATPLAGGVATVFVATAKGMSLAQANTGIFEIALQSDYPNLLSCSIMLQRASGAVDLIPQIASVDPTASAKLISFRMLAGATPTDLASGDVLYIQLMFRNSSG